MFVYAIYNKQHNKIYIGQTKDLEDRIKNHNNHTFRNSYTARYSGKWKLIYFEKAPTRSTALLREKQLKSHRGREFIRKHIPR